MSFGEEIMPPNKFLSIFSRRMEALIVFIIFHILFAVRSTVSLRYSPVSQSRDASGPLLIAIIFREESFKANADAV